MNPYYNHGGISLHNCNCLELLRQIPSNSVDAVITDPPYSSGGLSLAQRSAPPERKYVHSGTKVQRPTFTGDNRDGRGWAFWATLWLSECLRVVKPSRYALVFTDWRMLPTATDAMQAGGFTWRGIIAWDKTEGSRSPHTGYFRHQCEYVVWGTKGVSKKSTWGGPWPGAFRHSVCQSDKHHMTGKPTNLMRDLLQAVPPGGLVLDPFAGSGTTLVAAKLTGRQGIGAELEQSYCAIAAERLRNARA